MTGLVDFVATVLGEAVHVPNTYFLGFEVLVDSLFVLCLWHATIFRRGRVIFGGDLSTTPPGPRERDPAALVSSALWADDVAAARPHQRSRSGRQNTQLDRSLPAEIVCSPAWALAV